MTRWSEFWHEVAVWVERHLAHRKHRPHRPHHHHHHRHKLTHITLTLRAG